MDNQDLVFLFGAGISTAVGMPSTKDVTERVLSGQNVIRNGDGTYGFGDKSAIGREHHVPLMKSLVNKLSSHIALISCFNRMPNYEDIYYLAEQLYDYETENIDNPGVAPFADEVFSFIFNCARCPEFKNSSGEPPLQNGFSFSNEARRYIRCIVSGLLGKPPERIEGLEMLKQVCSDGSFSLINIFTLNHDAVLERFFSDIEIAIVDGFEKEAVNDVRYWNPELYDCQNAKVRLFKLHGSVNWFRFDPPFKFGIYLGNEINNIRDPQGKAQKLDEPTPSFLVGTYNKLFQYQSSIFLHLQHQFYRSLFNTRNLVVSGYSFGDKGINSVIISWMGLSDKNRIIIIHPEPENLKKNSRRAITRNWEDWEKNGRICVIKKRIQDVNWDEVKDCLISPNRSV